MSVNVIGRESERSEIRDFVVCCDKRHKGGVMYCAGPPGTGKTLCTKNVLDDWLNVKAHGCSKRMEYINVIGLSDHLKVFSAVESLLRGKSYATQVRKRGRSHAAYEDSAETFAQVADCVDSILSLATESRSSQPTCVLVVDELDYLCTSLSGVTRGGSVRSQQAMKKQIDLITNLFTLPDKLASSGITLVIIGIANSIDLASKLSVLYKRKSLIAHTLLFRPYSAGELKDIVISMTNGELDPVAVEITSRKVAAIHGDCRKVIDLVKQAKNFSNSKNSSSPQTTTVQDIMSVMNKAYKSQSDSVSSLKGLPLQQLLVLVAGCRYTLSHNDRSEFGILDLKNEFGRLVSELQIPSTVFGNLSAVIDHVTALSHSGLMTIRTCKSQIGRGSVLWRLNSPAEKLEETLSQTHSLVANALGSTFIIRE
jgi:Cdc6-like AAA superfamily ATPase